MTEKLIVVRSANPSDSVALADLHEQSWRLAYQGIIPHVPLERMIARRGPQWWLRHLLNRKSILLLDFDGTIGGYVSFGRNRCRSLPFEGEIQELYLSPPFQGLGFGKKLFISSRKALNGSGLRGLVVWALKDNESACSFYSHCGGRPVARAQEKFGKSRLQKVAFAWHD